jgi:adenine phosphoribosyltransferase
LLLVDDVLATGGTARAAVNLVKRLGGTLVAAAFLIELGFLHGRSKLVGEDLHVVLRY